MLKSPLPARARRAAGTALVAALALGGACAAWAARGPGEPVLIEAPDWIERPTGADVLRYYPATTRAQRTPANVVMTCRVDGAGRLERCVLVKENPAESGFGEAALKLSQHFRMAAKSKDGVATRGGQVRIPIRFMPPTAQ